MLEVAQLDSPAALLKPRLVLAAALQVNRQSPSVSNAVPVIAGW